MENETQSTLKIISIVNVIYSFLSRIILIVIIFIIRTQIPYLFLSLGNYKIDIFNVLIVMGILNMVSSALLLIFLHLPFKNNKQEQYFWLIFGVFLLVQPLFLTIIGILLIIYSHDMIRSKIETTIREEES